MSYRNLAMEMDDTYSERYARVHKTGCRHLRDPERLKTPTEQVALKELADAFQDATGWLYDEGEDQALADLKGLIAPCAKPFVSLR